MVENHSTANTQLFSADNVSSTLQVRREEYIEQMLAEVGAALSVCPDKTHDIFILFFGLNGESGQWTSHRIAAHFGITVDEVIAEIKIGIDTLPSEDHLTFVRKYSTIFTY